jgi:hypothetical protein
MMYFFFVDATLKQMASSRTPVTCTAEDVGDTVHVRCMQAMQTVAECTARVFPKKYYQEWNPATVEAVERRRRCAPF